MQWKYFGYVQLNVSPISFYFLLMWLLEIFSCISGLHLWLAWYFYCKELLYLTLCPSTGKPWASQPFSLLPKTLRSSCLESSDLLTYFMPECWWALSLSSPLSQSAENLLLEKVLKVEVNTSGIGRDIRATITISNVYRRQKGTIR